MAWPGTLSTKSTGELVDADDWNDVINGINHLGDTHDHSGDSGDGGTVLGTIEMAATSEVSVFNTVAETAFFNQTLSGGKLGTDQAVILEASGYIYTDGATTLDAPAFRLKYGSTTLCTVTPAGLYDASDSQLPFRLVAEVRADGATNDQRANMMLEFAGTPYGSDGSGVEAIIYDDGDGAEDSTGNLALQLTVQNDAAAADRGTHIYSTRVQVFKDTA